MMATETRETNKAKSKPSVGTDVMSSATPSSSGLLIAEGSSHSLVYDEVIAKVAGLAVREVAGVYDLAPWGAGQTLAKLGSQIGIGGGQDTGVRVETGTIECALDIRVVIHYGVSIPEVIRALRKHVTRRVEEMTGLKVQELNIEITDLHFEAERGSVGPHGASGRKLR